MDFLLKNYGNGDEDSSEENTPTELIRTVNMERINFSFPVMNSAPNIAPNCENKQKPVTHWKDLKLMDPIEMAGQTELQSICMCMHWYINILSFTKFLALFQFTGATALFSVFRERLRSSSPTDKPLESIHF